MGLTWEEAKVKIELSANKFGEEKKVRLSSVKTWDRQDHDIKEIINQIAESFDPKSSGLCALGKSFQK